VRPIEFSAVPSSIRYVACADAGLHQSMVPAAITARREGLTNRENDVHVEFIWPV
jgi:hypothetical protein